MFVGLCTYMYIGGVATQRRAASKADRARVCAALRATAGTAHTEDKSVTAAVFHAPMFALNADADSNACEPNHTPRFTPT
jgi:hypothetical protein